MVETDAPGSTGVTEALSRSNTYSVGEGCFQWRNTQADHTGLTEVTQDGEGVAEHCIKQ